MAVAQAERGVRPNNLPQNGRKPLYYEGLAGPEFAWFITSPVYRGIGVPLGDGSPVMAIPGLFGSDAYLVWTKDWLTRIGYHDYSSGISIANVDPDRHIDKTTGILEEIVERTGRKSYLIGHSLGGIYAKMIALSRPDLVRGIIALGSPFKGDPDKSVDPFIIGAGRRIIPQLRNPDQLKKRREELSKPLMQGIRLTSLYTKADGVIDWHSCIDTDPQAQNIEVPGTHTGLIWNPRVYEHIAHILASVPEKKLSTSLSSLGFAA